MPNVQEATAIVHKNYPEGKIQKFIVYKDLFLFQVFSDDPFEGQWDPYYSVNQKTGEFRDFSIITDGDIVEITNLFAEAKS